MASPPSPGTDLHADRSAFIREAIGITLPLAILATAGRFASRRMIKAKLNASDYMCIASLIGVLAFAALTLESIKYGFGKHVKTLSPENLETFLKIFYAAEMFYVYNITAIKITILLLYVSVFPSKGFAIAARFIAAICCGWAIACLFGAIFSCTPVRGFWDHSIPSKCLNSSKFFIGNAAPNIATDVAILCLPMRELWRLHMSTKTKIAVSGFFLAGGFVVIASSVRLALIVHQDLSDPTYGLVTIFTWSNIEINTGLMSACLPTMRPLLQKVWPTFVLSKISGKSSNAANGQQRSKDLFAFRPIQGYSSDEFHRLKECTASNNHAGTLPRDTGAETVGSFGLPTFPENSFAPSERSSGLQHV